MNHLVIVPVLLPLVTGVLLLLLADRSVRLSRIVSLFSASALVGVCGLLVVSAGRDNIEVYALGNWAPPFGIVLILDRLSALMLGITSVLALFSLGFAARGEDTRGSNLHSLVHFLLMGVNGAFLTGDLFNLFVFFEVLLLASYALLLHGGGPARVRAGLHYVILNLTGSCLFLIAAAMLYGLTGTLNMADMAGRVAALNPADAPLVAAAGALLLVVFGLKAAVVPLYFWLPRAYASAAAPVAALFAIMTKVGVYGIIRVYPLIFGDSAGGTEPPMHHWPVSPAVSGMAFYTGDAFPHWRGNLLIGALAGQALIRLELDGDRIVHEERLLQVMDRIRDVRVGPDGLVYLLTDGTDGKLLRLEPAAPTAAR